MRQPRLALFLHSLEGGGAERISINLAAGVAARGVAVDLVLVRAEGPYLDQVERTVRIVDLGCRRHLTCLLPLARYLRREHPDVLLSALTHTNLYALAARRIAGTPTRVVIRINNTLSEERRDEASALARLLRPPMVRALYPWADGIASVSQGAADDLLATLPRLRVPMRVVTNPVVVPRLFQLAEEPLSHPWFGDGAPPVLLAVGRLTPQKDFGTLIRAFAEVWERHRARLLILGDGGERPRLERLLHELDLADDVSLPGFTANPYPYMASARGLVLSSRYEGSPSVLVEALALGTPVASTDCPFGPREILENGRWGRLVGVGDSHGLAEAMTEILEGSPLARPGPKDMARYHLDRAVTQYIDLMGLPPPAPSPAVVENDPA